MLRSKAAAIGRAGLRGARRHWVLITVPIVLLIIAAYVLASLRREPHRHIPRDKMNTPLRAYPENINPPASHPSGSALGQRPGTIPQA